jgi:hypothetical protein
MHVIGHQAVGVDSTVKPCGEFAEQFQIGGKVTVIQETGVAIDPPLDDMKREPSSTARARLGMPAQRCSYFTR